MNDKLKKEKREKEFEEWVENPSIGWLNDTMTRKEFKASLKSFISKLIQQEVPKGVCKHCWNKGYSTEMTEVVSSADFFGDKEYKTGAKITINFCKCDKGKQLKELIQREREEELDRIGLEKIYSESEKDRDLVVGYNQAIEDLEKIKSNLLKGRNKQKD